LIVHDFFIVCVQYDSSPETSETDKQPKKMDRKNDKIKARNKNISLFAVRKNNPIDPRR
jgi:hypothetical protein